MSTGRSEIRICTGTSCYVMGAAELVDELEHAIEAGTLQAGLSGATCLGLCRREGSAGVAPGTVADATAGAAGTESVETGAPPYVVVDGHVLAQARTDTILDALRRRKQEATWQE